MKPIIVHSVYSADSRAFVDQFTEYEVLNWDSFDDRNAAIRLFGNLSIRGVPSVLVDAPAWFKPPAFYGDILVNYPSSIEPIFNPKSWDDVEKKIAFFSLRTKGYIEGVELPDCEAILWGDVPEPPEGHDSVFDGWDIVDDVARRRWRFEEHQEGIETDDDDDKDPGDR